ncbi:hypothetical protein MRX96_043897, partial [Rhipicephalus microplus]
VVSATDERADVDIDVDDGRARPLRPKRRSFPTTTFGCPVCGVTLRQQELQQHWQVEVDRLQGIARNVARRYRSESTSAGRFSWMNPRRRSFERVRSNRGQRRQGTQVYCPVCQIALRGPPELLAEHVNECLAMADLIPLASSEPSEEHERRLRQAVVSSAGPVDRSNASPRREEDCVIPKEVAHVREDKPASHGAELDLPEGAMSQVVESLRERLRELESENQAVSKCLICMDPYENPVVSIVCWHVHCQECWLKTLGAKKLCPQCNSITSASDLRRIYL